MSDVNFRNMSFIIILLLLLVVLSGSVLYFTSHDSSSIYTQINNPNLEK